MASVDRRPHYKTACEYRCVTIGSNFVSVYKRMSQCLSLISANYVINVNENKAVVDIRLRPARIALELV